MGLPVRLIVTDERGLTRTYLVYVWTIGHGGKSRTQDEYRIQAKLPVGRDLTVGGGTTLLLGYYHEEADRAGRELGNTPNDGMEIFVAWDASKHLRVGTSSSCQVPFGLMDDARLVGSAWLDRRIAHGERETVIALRPEMLAKYLSLASGGHTFVSPGDLTGK